jgi:hypothetical protein
MPRLSTSTWSLHRAIGTIYPDAPGERHGAAIQKYGPGSVSLLDIPARLAEMGIHTMEICHFHLPAQDTRFLKNLRSALDVAGVELFSVLIDDGDMTHPEHGERDLAWIGEWVDIAGQLGAKRARIIAGKSQPSEAALERSRKGFSTLIKRASQYNLRLMTENWFDLLSTPATVHSLLGSLDKQVGLCVDFGNWRGATKYDDLAAIFHLGESCHAKCSFAAPQLPDEADYRRCLDLSRAAAFNGPYTLIYDGPDDGEWRGLTLEREMVRPYLVN